MGNATSSCRSKKDILFCHHVNTPYLYKDPYLEMYQKSKPDMKHEHYSRLFKKLYELRSTGELTDVEIKHGQSMYCCHSIVLMCRSSFFSKKITEHFQKEKVSDGSVTNKLCIIEDDMKQDVLEDLLNFIYLGFINIPKHRATEYVEATQKWDLYYIFTNRKVNAEPYVRRYSTAMMTIDVFTEKELLSEFIYIHESNFEGSVQKELSLHHPFSLNGTKKIAAVPPYNFAISSEDGLDINCHRELLVGFSDYFHAMLVSSSFKESQENKVILQGIDGSTLKAILRFIYCGEVAFDTEMAMKVASTSGWLCPDSELYFKAQLYLMKSIDHENCIKMLHFADVHSLDGLYAKAAEVAFNDIESVSAQRSFPQLPPDIVSYYLASDKLCVASEIKVLAAFGSWAVTKTDKDTVYKVFQKSIRLGLFSLSELQTLVSATQMSRSCWIDARYSNQLPCMTDIKHDFLKALQVAMELPIELRLKHYQQSYRNFYLSHQSVLFSSDFRPTLGRMYLLLYSVKHSFNSPPQENVRSVLMKHYCKLRRGQSFLFLALAQSDWLLRRKRSVRREQEILMREISLKHLYPKSEFVTFFSVTANQIAQEQERERVDLNNVTEYAPFDCFATAVFDNSIYITGGNEFWNNESNERHPVVNICLIYKPSTVGCWTTGPPLLTSRSSHSMVAVGDSLYVFGGLNRNGNVVRSVERLQYLKPQWTHETTMMFDACNVVCAAMKERIYVFSMTQRGKKVFASMHCYSTSLRSWLQSALLWFNQPLPPMCFCDAIALKGKIYVFAITLSDNKVSVVSVLDTQDDTWYPGQFEIDDFGYPVVLGKQLCYSSSVKHSGSHPISMTLHYYTLNVESKLDVGAETFRSYTLPSTDQSNFDWKEKMLKTTRAYRTRTPAFLCIRDDHVAFPGLGEFV